MHLERCECEKNALNWGITVFKFVIWGGKLLGFFVINCIIHLLRRVIINTIKLTIYFPRRLFWEQLLSNSTVLHCMYTVNLISRSQSSVQTTDISK